ncbi:MAG: hypothetical protein AAFY22_03360 [Pseudomonadota bacterium]
MLQDLTQLFDQPLISPPAERRLTERLVGAWARAARGRYPRWDDLRRHVDAGDAASIFVIDIETARDYPHFVYIGDTIAKLSGAFVTGDADWSRSLLDIAAQHALRAAALKEPRYCDQRVHLCDGRSILYRTLSAPLADDGQSITHILGAANGRFVTRGV